MNITPFPCPCCGRLVFSEAAGSEEICPVCFWQDDLFGLLDPFNVLGPNKVSLESGQTNYAASGISDTRLDRFKARLASASRFAPDIEWRLISAQDRFDPEE
ncbi:CPCC family cysteine-rich protein [Caenimonas aquaedulcis]|uniref:Cysteine-rich CPCC domain-containing protein n=1 Tax=Caenimonas aquaedulcis TaxID=2793270 RepID=A0A931H159_9BURK|nr:hypothetical protein [Caenimonas aquaedulcis]